MSFYTSLQYYRPTRPPRVTGDSLARFVAAFAGLDVAEDNGPLTVEVKFGEAIDQDDRPSAWDEPVYETISVVREIDWDVEVHCASPRAVAAALKGHDRPVYRAHIQLGQATADIRLRMGRVGSPENEVDLRLSDWSLEVGPVVAFDLGSEELFQVGWISIGLSGYGYLYPWTFAELVRRAEDHPAIRQMTELCRATWPVQSGRPDRQTKRLRKRMGDLWPYREIDRPWDWYWGLCESG